MGSVDVLATGDLKEEKRGIVVPALGVEKVGVPGVRGVEGNRYAGGELGRDEREEAYES